MGLALTASTGCTISSNAAKAIGDHECIDDFMVSHRNRVMAARAWHREKACLKDHCHLDDVKRGFMDAYAEAAGGGDPCVPTVAPRSYWGWRYQSADGNGAVNAWFEGYPLGMKAAEQDGVTNYNTIQMANHQTRTSATPYGSLPAPAPGQVQGGNATDGMIPVPGGYVNANGDFFDTKGNLVGKATVEDRAVGEIISTPEAEKPAAQELPVENFTPADSLPADAIDRVDNDLSGAFPAGVKVVEPYAEDASAFTANLSDQATGSEANSQEASSFDSGAYQLDDPSQEEIDAVIDDIFGKPQSTVSEDAEDTNTFESIPFTFE